MRAGSRHGPWNCLVLYLRGTIGAQWAVDSAIVTGFYSYRFSPKYTHLTCRKFICQHSATTETTVKQRPLAFIWFDLTSALFWAISTRVIHSWTKVYRIFLTSCSIDITGVGWGGVGGVGVGVGVGCGWWVVGGVVGGGNPQFVNVGMETHHISTNLWNVISVGAMATAQCP